MKTLKSLFNTATTTFKAIFDGKRWRQLLILSVTLWNDDLFEDQIFRATVHRLMDRRHQPIRHDIFHQMNSLKTATHTANMIFQSLNDIARVLILRLHNGEKTVHGYSLYKLSTLTEHLRKGHTAMQELIQNLSLESLSYNVQDLLEAQQPVWISLTEPNQAEIQRNPRSQLYKITQAMGIQSLLVSAVIDADNIPVGIIEIHFTTTLTEQLPQGRQLLKEAALELAANL